MAKTWDMVTSGASAGSLIRPLRYTQTEADATRVRVWCRIATPLGAYKLRPSDGLPHARMLDPGASDEERAAYVRDLILDDPGVDSIVSGPVVTVDDGALGLTLRVTATFLTTDGTAVTIG